MAYDEELAERARSMVAPELIVDEIAMFGGLAFIFQPSHGVRHHEGLHDGVGDMQGGRAGAVCTALVSSQRQAGSG